MISFIDLAAQQKRIRQRIDMRIKSVLDHGSYIMGPEVRELEGRLAEFCGAKYCISCANGTDALQLVLMALGLGEGDAVFVPSFTFAATAEVIPSLGATPVFVDIDPATYNMDQSSLRRAVSHARKLGLRPFAMIPVDLFGLPANYSALKAVADDEGLVLISDSAQGWGATIDGQMTGTFGLATTTSFFPAKPLGCYGDGGAIFTDDAELVKHLDSLRVHGKGSEKYDNVRVGMNSRLDTIQAAILLEKLSIYADEIAARNLVAKRYSESFQNHFGAPYVPSGYQSVWAQYTLKAACRGSREAVMAAAKAQGIPTAIYYPRPLHEQTAYRKYPRDPKGLQNSSDASNRVFSIPMHPYMEEDAVTRVIEVLIGAVEG